MRLRRFKGGKGYFLGCCIRCNALGIIGVMDSPIVFSDCHIPADTRKMQAILDTYLAQGLVVHVDNEIVKDYYPRDYILPKTDDEAVD